MKPKPKCHNECGVKHVLVMRTLHGRKLPSRQWLYYCPKCEQFFNIIRYYNSKSDYFHWEIERYGLGDEEWLKMRHADKIVNTKW